MTFLITKRVAQKMSVELSKLYVGFTISISNAHVLYLCLLCKTMRELSIIRQPLMTYDLKLSLEA